MGRFGKVDYERELSHFALDTGAESSEYVSIPIKRAK
jgi:hypothetical protein